MATKKYIVRYSTEIFFDVPVEVEDNGDEDQNRWDADDKATRLLHDNGDVVPNNPFVAKGSGYLELYAGGDWCEEQE